MGHHVYYMTVEPLLTDTPNSRHLQPFTDAQIVAIWNSTFLTSEWRPPLYSRQWTKTCSEITASREK